MMALATYLTKDMLRQLYKSITILGLGSFIIKAAAGIQGFTCTVAEKIWQLWCWFIPPVEPQNFVIQLWHIYLKHSSSGYYVHLFPCWPPQVKIWDTAGSEKYMSISAVYYRKADGVIFLFDVTKAKSFTNIESVWMAAVEAPERLAYVWMCMCTCYVCVWVCKCICIHILYKCMCGACEAVCVCIFVCVCVCVCVCDGLILTLLCP